MGVGGGGWEECGNIQQGFIQDICQGGRGGAKVMIAKLRGGEDCSSR